jgi:hypothetical protein
MSLQVLENLDYGALFDAIRQRMSEEEWGKTTNGVPLTREMFVDYCRQQGYIGRGIECDGRQVGGVFFDGTSAHIEIEPEYHGRWALVLPTLLRWVFTLKDPIQVDIARHEPKINRFMARNNWPRIKETDDFITYEMSSKATPFLNSRLKAAQ